MSIFDNIKNLTDKIFNIETCLKNNFVQYHHFGRCAVPCEDCKSKNNRVFENNNTKPLVGEENHPHCDCYYTDIETKTAGSVSKLGINGPDYYLKYKGKLPDYYITKDEAINVYGWNNSKNTIAGKAPGKMIGGDVYINKEKFLPIKNGRTWKYCDVDYISGGRSNLRLFYSNDGLMFFSTNHLDKNNPIVYQVI